MRKTTCYLALIIFLFALPAAVVGGQSGRGDSAVLGEGGDVAIPDTNPNEGLAGSSVSDSFDGSSAVASDGGTSEELPGGTAGPAGGGTAEEKVKEPGKGLGDMLLAGGTGKSILESDTVAKAADEYVPKVMKDYLSWKVLGISLYQYALAFLFILLAFLTKSVARRLYEVALEKTKATDFRYDEVLVHSVGPPISWAFFIVFIYLATLMLPILEEPLNLRRFVAVVVKSSSAVLVVWAGLRLIDQLTEAWMERASKTETKMDEQFIPIVRSSTRVFFILIGIVLVLQNLGYSVTSLVAGLGIGGAAVAFASKDALANLFGSVVIFLDRPFQIGDWIQVGDVEGTVEEVGLRTTRIRTFPNSVITLPNSALTVTAINNWSRMRKRRIMTTIGVTYDTSPERLEEGVAAIRRLIGEDPAIHSDFYLVNFEGFGASSLDIFIYCFTVTTNWAEFMEARQNFYLNIMREFDKLGLSFAFPTRTVHIESMPGEPAAMKGERPKG